MAKIGAKLIPLYHRLLVGPPMLGIFKPIVSI